jgi:hypothetical protein
LQIPIAPTLPPGITESLFDAHTGYNLRKAVQALTEAEEHERGGLFTRLAEVQPIV